MNMGEKKPVMRRAWRERIWIWTVALALGPALSSCTGRRATPADTLIVALGAQPSTLDPRFATDADGMRIGGLIFESLTRVGDGFQAKGQAAERWTYKDKLYTFYLRPDLRFHNGRAVTPDDIDFSFTIFRADSSPFASSLKIIKSAVTTQEGGRLVTRIRVNHFSDKFLISDLPAVKILPRREVTALGRDFSQALIGTGPYRFGKVDLNEIRLESVRAAIPHLVFKVIRDDFTRYQKLLKGEVDLAQAEIAAERVADFEKRPDRFQVFRYPGLTTSYILINFKDPVLARKSARLALAHSLQRDEIIRFKMNGLAREATSILTPENPYFDHALVNPSFDPDGARRVIRSLGLDGKRLILKTSNSPQAIDNGKVLANQLSRCGLDIDLQSYEWGTFYADVRKGNFQLATMRWVGTVDPDIYQLAFHSREVPPGRNRGSYINPKLDLLLDEGSREENRGRRMRVFRRVQEIVQNDLAILPLWYDEQVAIAGKNVLNFHPSLSSDFLPLAAVRKTEH
jgi:peptide/nickel transport system substrate-binding protein